MEHIYLSPHFERIPVDVPFYGLFYDEDTCVHKTDSLCEPCQGQGWRGWTRFAHIKGFKDWSTLPAESREVPDPFAAGKCSPVKVEAVFQAFMYFGMLVAFFGKDVQQDFVPSGTSNGVDATRRQITTVSLNDRLMTWVQKTKKLEPDQKRRTLQITNEMLDHVSSNELNDKSKDWWAANPVSTEVWISVAALHQTLREAWNQAQDDMSDWSSQGPLPFSYALSDLVSSLKNKFWCLRDIARLGSNVALLYFAIHLGPRKPALIHTTDTCSSSSCGMENVDEADYNIRHQDPECTCDLFRGSEAAILNSIETGKQIGVAYANRANQPAPRTNPGPRIAISHLWADGLGNPTENAIPTCQARWIQEVVDNAAIKVLKGPTPIETPVMWWLDTLIVPIKDDVLRKKAIANMNAVYGTAAFTLVIDAEIMRHHVSTCPIENMMRVLFSRWSHRMWTLHESWTASHIIIQFADKAVDFSELLGRVDSNDHKASVCMQQIVRDLEHMAFNMKPSLVGNDWDTQPDKRLYMAFRGAESRAASKGKDELICLAGMAGWPPEKISQIAQAELKWQTHEFVSIQHEVPRALAMASGPKLAEPGFRWCPERLLRNWVHEMPPLHPDRLHVVTKGGLLGRWNVVQFLLSPINFLTLPGQEHRLPRRPSSATECIELCRNLQQFEVHIPPGNALRKAYTAFLNYKRLSDLLSNHTSTPLALLTNHDSRGIEKPTNHRIHAILVQLMDQRRFEGQTEPVVFARIIEVCTVHFQINACVGDITSGFAVAFEGHETASVLSCID